MVRIALRKSEFAGVQLLLAGFAVATALVLLLCWTASGRLPDYIGRELAGEELAAVLGRNSSLAEYAWLSPCADFPRAAKIDTITIHHMGADLQLAELGERFANQDRRTSANYGIDNQGRVGIFVEEANRAWTSSNAANDARAVPIEVANDEMGGDWQVSEAAFAALVGLCADVCRRSDIPELTYTGNAQGNLTCHRMFANTVCPGPYLEGRLGELAAAVNQRLRE